MVNKTFHILVVVLHIVSVVGFIVTLITCPTVKNIGKVHSNLCLTEQIQDSATMVVFQ